MTPSLGDHHLSSPQWPSVQVSVSGVPMYRMTRWQSFRCCLVRVTDLTIKGPDQLNIALPAQQNPSHKFGEEEERISLLGESFSWRGKTKIGIDPRYETLLTGCAKWAFLSIYETLVCVQQIQQYSILDFGTQSYLVLLQM